jgi:hypothetical protein
MGSPPERERTQLRQSPFENRQSYLDNYFSNTFGHLYPKDIDHAEFRREFDNWLLDLRSYRDEDKKLSRATKNKIIYSVNDFIEELIDLKKMAVNPLTGLKKYNKEPENPRGVIDRDSLSKMFPQHHGALLRTWGASMWGRGFSMNARPKNWIY